MTTSSDFTFAEVIEPTRENAAAVKRLTLQDLIAGEFPNALELADPSNRKQVRDQRKRLRKHPERYSGYFKGDELVAYIKQNEWRVADELPFVFGEQYDELKALYDHNKAASTGQWGVFGLVVSDKLDKESRDELLTLLLEESLTDPKTGKTRTTVNIVLHANDPLLEIVSHYGFDPVGRLGEAAGAPGILQPRYQRSVSH